MGPPMQRLIEVDKHYYGTWVVYISNCCKSGKLQQLQCPQYAGLSFLSKPNFCSSSGLRQCMFNCKNSQSTINPMALK